jgi:xanthine dehydrogenase accessory factor
MPWDSRILIIGAGDTGTVSALRLFRSGFHPILLERNHPSDLHYNRNFSDAVYQGKKKIDNVDAILVYSTPFNETVEQEIKNTQKNRCIPLICSDDLSIISRITPEIIIVCTGNFPDTLQLDWELHPLVIKIGLSYNVGIDGHVIIGDSGNKLGLVFRQPHELNETTSDQTEYITAPIEGVFISSRTFGERLSERDEIGTINDISILSPSDGYLTGLLHSGHFVSCRQPLFEITPTAKMSKEHKALPAAKYAIAGGVLEAILSYLYEKSL